MGHRHFIIRGATLVTEAGQMRADLCVTDGRITGMSTETPPNDVAIVDADGLLLLPGMVDSHVHFMDPAEPSRETFPKGSAAAAVAGVTTLLEHSHGQPVYRGEQLDDKVHYLRERSHVDFGLGAHLSHENVEDIASVWRAGAAFIKVFTCTTHGIDAVPNGLLLQAMHDLAQEDPIFYIHAEDESITEVAEAKLRASGRQDGQIVPQWRNLIAEQVAVDCMGRLALATGARVIIAHCSDASIVDTVVGWRDRGARMIAEGCPQYFFLFEDEVQEHGSFRKFTPPARARSQEDLETMWDRLVGGAIDYLASDHAPSTREQKMSGSIWDAPFGLPGIDTTFPMMLDAALRGRMSLQKLVRLYSASPARIYGLYPRKGSLMPGSDADFILVDPTTSWTLDDSHILSKAGWTPFAGRQLQGKVVATYVRGKKVAENQQVTTDPGVGRFLPGPGLER